MEYKGLLFPLILAIVALLAVAEESVDTTKSSTTIPPIDQDVAESSHKHKKKCHQNYYHQSYYPSYEPKYHHYQQKSDSYGYQEEKYEPKYEKKYPSYKPKYHYGGD